MQKGCSYIKHSRDFLKKIKNLCSLPENPILVPVDVVGFYPSIPHDAGLQAHEETLENRHHKQIPTYKLVNTNSNLKMFSNRYLVQQLAKYLQRHTHVFSWIKLNLIF